MKKTFQGGYLQQEMVWSGSPIKWSTTTSGGNDGSSTEGQLGDKPKWTILDSRHVETEVHA